MSTLELLQLENEHNDNFFGKGEENQVMSNEYVIYEDDDFEPGDGQKVYIKDGYILFESTAEGGYVGFEWKCDIESLKHHIAKYEQGLKGEEYMTGYDIVDKEVRKYQEEYYERTNCWTEDFIVIFDYKYEWENRYDHTVEFCSVYYEGTQWENDWYEGQTDIVVKKIVALRELYDIFVDKTK